MIIKVAFSVFIRTFFQVCQIIPNYISSLNESNPNLVRDPGVYLVVSPLCLSKTQFEYFIRLTHQVSCMTNRETDI